MRNAWRTYVLGLNYARQQEAIYVPVREGLISGLVGLTDRQAWKNLARTIARWLSPTYWGLSNGGWFSCAVAMAAIVFMLALLGSTYVVRLFVGRLRRWSRDGLALDGHGRADVAFYRRFEALLAQRELCRTPSQTQREFALAVGGQLAESTHTTRCPPWPANWSSCFTACASAAHPGQSGSCCGRTSPFRVGRRPGAGRGTCAQDRK